MQFFSELKYNSEDLIPAIIQEHGTHDVLMMAYMNPKSLQKTLQTGNVVFYSRSRQTLWTKGETSGNYMKWVSIRTDCDGDCLLISVKPMGPACHTGARSCFFRKLDQGEIRTLIEDSEYVMDIYDREKGKEALNIAHIIEELHNVVLDRKNAKKEGSYTNYLFEKGIDKILKKVGEESAETIIAAKNNSKEEIVNEVSDLIYHLIVMLVDRGVAPTDIYDELERRKKE